MECTVRNIIINQPARIGMSEDELEMFCNLYRNVEATDQGSGHMKGGEHKFCT